MKNPLIRTTLRGFLAGAGVSVVVFMCCALIVMESQYKQKMFYYEGYLFRQKCAAEGKTDLQAATERYRIVHNEPGFEAKDHPDVKNGHPEAFIRGTLGYELWTGFGYGKKPGRLETLFERRTFGDTCCFIWMTVLPGIVMLAAPILGATVGCTWSLWRRCAARQEEPRG